VVAPAVRSTASNKIKLKASQVNLAKKLGLTPEQYALETTQIGVTKWLNKIELSEN
jgi:hypothetical protein